MATQEQPIDSPSAKGKFGWERIGTNEFAVPVIVRSNRIRYSPVRIVEQEIIKKYGALPQPVFNCITLKSFYLTICEAKLLNIINHFHCNNMYGENEFSTKDVIISAPDVKELSRYLNISYEIFVKDLSKVSAMFGIIRLTFEPDKPDVILVPYITKSFKGKPVKFIPSTLIDKIVTISDDSVRGTPNDWDIMYLKMLCIFCANSLQQHINRGTQIIQLDGLMYLKSNIPIIYEDYKPPARTDPITNWQQS